MGPEIIVLLLFLGGVVASIYFLGNGRSKRTRIPRASAPPLKSGNKESFDGPFAPHATSSLAMMNELYRQHRLAHSHQRDQQIMAELKARLENGEEDGFSAVHFKCKFGRVTLAGRVSSAAEKAQAESIAQSIFGVIDVSNQIVVVSAQKAS